MNITPSLKLCQKMKELGYPQEGTYFFHYEEIGGRVTKIAAPTVEEMLEWLISMRPKEVGYYIKAIQTPVNNYMLSTTKWYSSYKKDFISDTLSNACAKAVIWVLEKGGVE